MYVKKTVLKAVGILVFLVLSSMFVCPALAAVAPPRTEHFCGDHTEQDKPPQPSMKGCCDQLAVLAKEAQLVPSSSWIDICEPASLSGAVDYSGMTQEKTTYLYLKHSERLAALSLLRI